MRSAIVILLIIVGGILLIPGTLGVWQDRAVLDEDAFVDTVDESFDQKEVQTVLADRLTDQVMDYLAVEERLSSGLAELDDREDNLPEGLVLLKGPLSDLARDAIYRISLRVLDSDVVDAALEAGLRQVHRVVVAVINDDSEVLSLNGDDIVLDLEPVLADILREAGGDRGEEFLEEIEVSPDAGKIMIGQTSEISVVWDSIYLLDQAYPVLAGVSVLLFVAATVMSSNRRVAIIFIGAMVTFGAAAQVLVVAQPLKGLVIDAVASPDGKAASEATYDVLVDSFKRQELFLLLIGVVMMVGGALAGETEWRQAGGAVLRGRPEAQIGLGEWMRKRALPLRIAGFVAGGLFVIIWPDPSTRLTLTVLGFVALYLVFIAVISSDARWAEAIRSPFGVVWDRYFRVDERAADYIEGGVIGWIALRAPWLRLAVLATGAAVLILKPEVSIGTVVLVVALDMIAFAALDLAVGSIDHNKRDGA